MDWTVEQSEVKFNVKLPPSTQFDAAAVKATLGVGCPIGMSSKPRPGAGGTPLLPEEALRFFSDLLHNHGMKTVLSSRAQYSG